MKTEKAKALVGLLAQECTNIEDVQALLKELFKSTIEQMHEAEMDEHLGYDKHSPIGNNSGNRRNKYSKKTVKSSIGETEIVVLRDRKSEFEPQLLEKRETRTNDLGNRILAMYAKGMSNRDIEDQLHDVYGVDASASLISRITDKILPAINEWQIRPLENGFHRMLRKYTKMKTIYPTDDSVKKSAYLSIQEISKKWSMPVRDWGRIIGQLPFSFKTGSVSRTFLNIIAGS